MNTPVNTGVCERVVTEAQMNKPKTQCSFLTDFFIVFISNVCFVLFCFFELSLFFPNGAILTRLCPFVFWFMMF